MDFSLLSAWPHSISTHLLFLGATFLLAWFVYRRKVRGIESAFRVLFQEDLSKRTRAAHDLHDALLQTIEASKMIADDALDAPEDPATMRRAMRRLSNWLGQATQEGQALLILLGTLSSNRNGLVSQFRRFAEECLNGRDITFDLSVTGESTEMNPVICDEVYRIGCDAINSACNRTGTTCLRIALTYDRDFHLQVEDNGEPADPPAEKRRDGHLDFNGMRDRAKRFGATLNLVCFQNPGTKVTLVVPGRVIFKRTS